MFMHVHGEGSPGAIVLGCQPVGKGRVAATGDVVLTASAVNPVHRALRNHALFADAHLFSAHFRGSATRSSSRGASARR